MGSVVEGSNGFLSRFGKIKWACSAGVEEVVKFKVLRIGGWTPDFLPQPIKYRSRGEITSLIKGRGPPRGSKTPTKEQVALDSPGP